MGEQSTRPFDAAGNVTFRFLMTGLLSIVAVDSLAQQTVLRLSTANLQQWKADIEPDARESSYLRIPWLESFLKGMREAKQLDKPVMLFIMNGHPLGCT